MADTESPPVDESGGRWRDRIVGHSTADPAVLMPNPQNYRRHPAGQQAAMTAILEEIGWVQSVIVNRRTGHLIDGHMRVELAIRNGEKPIPVVEVDLDIQEEKNILSILDPVGSLAFVDVDMQRELMAETTLSDERLSALIGSINNTNQSGGYTGFLDNIADQKAGNAAVPGSVPDTYAGANIPDGMVSVVFALTPSEREELFDIINDAKETEGLETSNQVIMHLCRFWVNATGDL